MAKGTGPVVLGVSKSQLNQAIQKGLDDAKAKGVPNAHSAQVEAIEAGIIQFHGIDDEAAKDLWKHMEPTVKKNLPQATIKHDGT